MTGRSRQALVSSIFPDKGPRCRLYSVVSGMPRVCIYASPITHMFRENVGVTPKLYCRLARFQAVFAFAGIGDRVNWAQAYADQSQMIAEFREFSSLTLERLAMGCWFHPFIERAARSLISGAEDRRGANGAGRSRTSYAAPWRQRSASSRARATAKQSSPSCVF